MCEKIGLSTAIWYLTSKSCKHGQLLARSWVYGRSGTSSRVADSEVTLRLGTDSNQVCSSPAISKSSRVTQTAG